MRTLEQRRSRKRKFPVCVHVLENGRRRTAKPSAYARKRREEKRRIEIMLSSARARAKEGGYPFTISEEHVRIPEFCPLLGLRLKRGIGIPTHTSPSLDKINPKLGYVPGNVWVVSQRANSLKSNATLEELQTLVANWFLFTRNSGLPNQQHGAQLSRPAVRLG